MIKKIFLLGALTILFMGNSRLEYSKEVYLKDEKMYTKKDNKLYTGNVYKKFEDGTLEIGYLDGVKTGNIKSFYPNGKLKREIMEKDSVSSEKIYYENGVLALDKKTEEKGRNLKRESKSYYNNGNIKEEVIEEYSEGGLISLSKIQYTISGEIKRKEILKDDVWTYKSLEEDDIETYKEYSTPRGEYDKYVGVYKSYKNGELKEDLVYDKDSKLMKESKIYNENGEKKEGILKEIFKENEEREITKVNLLAKDRYEIEYEDESGNLHRDIFENGIYYESGVKYNDYGLIEEEQPKEDGKKLGIWKKYKNGIISSEEVYEKGNFGSKLVATKDYWIENPTGEYVIKEYDDYREVKSWFPNGKIRKEKIEDGDFYIEKLYTPSGELAYEKKTSSWSGELVDEKKHIPRYLRVIDSYGTWISKYPNGQLAFTGEYESGKRMKDESAMYREDGSLIYKILYEKDETKNTFPTNIKIYYENGNLKYERVLKNNVVVSEKTFYEDGKIMYLDERDESGKSKHEERYFSNGQLAGKTFYSDEMKNIIDGEYVRYYPNGKLKVFGNFKDGLLNGEYKEFYSNGNLKLLINYDTLEETRYYNDGKLQEKSVFDEKNRRKILGYYKNGTLKKEIYFDEEKGEKISKTYYLNGTLKSFGDTTYYSNGQKKQEILENGTIIRYYINGQEMEVKTPTVRTKYDEDGRVISKGTIDGNDEIYFITGELQEKRTIEGRKSIEIFYNEVGEVVSKKTYAIQPYLQTLELLESKEYNEWGDIIK